MTERIDGRRQRRIDATHKIVVETFKEIRTTGQWRPTVKRIAERSRCSVRTVFDIFGAHDTLLTNVFHAFRKDLRVVLRAQFFGIAGTDELMQDKLIKALMGLEVPPVPTAIWTQAEFLSDPTPQEAA